MGNETTTQITQMLIENVFSSGNPVLYFFATIGVLSILTTIVGGILRSIFPIITMIFYFIGSIKFVKDNWPKIKEKFKRKKK